MKGQISYDLASPPEDPFYYGIPSDIEERAREYLWARGNDDPTEGDILDVSYTIYEDDIRRAEGRNDV